MIIIVMGVSGSGKSTVGRLLAEKTGWRFIEGDHYHPAENQAKMAAAEPLNDQDRQPWLASLANLIDRHLQMDRCAVLSCSALKQSYRDQLMRSPGAVHFVYLEGSYELILSRLKQRTDHFMRVELLQSQFNDLEPPSDALKLSIEQPADRIADQIMKRLQLAPGRAETQVALDQLMFPEAPRWRDNQLWFTDQHARQVVRLDLQGESHLVAELDDLPGGLGWLPDGRLLVVSMTKRRILALTDQKLTLYADLYALASFHCNDLLVDPQGRCYAGNFGFDLHGGEAQAPAELILVDRDAKPQLAAEQLIFPNGCALSPDGKTLLVAETFASRITAFTVSTDGSLSGRRVWADLNGAYPDGITLDSQQNLWVAAPNRSRLLLVKQGGEILREVIPVGDPYACMVGGAAGDTLFITSSETDNPEEARRLRSGRIETLTL
ncbi:MAG: gluconokinase, GntK/IdnK-type [Candidatus Thiodiazotropha endolucinida]|nr:gluconokinase, GntK/IdnK-type [Candidatus Thiodiazotropha taylori]MCW4242314.1 gluconokinase, GntK/IdnK-type [Candidatus Thiodiazotropha taylori]